MWVCSIIALVRSRIEPIACTIKYFMAASEVSVFFLGLINGRKDIRFSSRPAHIRIHESADIATIVPQRAVVINRGVDGTRVSIKLGQEMILPKYD